MIQIWLWDLIAQSAQSNLQADQALEELQVRRGHQSDRLLNLRPPPLLGSLREMSRSPLFSLAAGTVISHRGQKKQQLTYLFLDGALTCKGLLLGSIQITRSTIPHHNEDRTEYRAETP